MVHDKLCFFLFLKTESGPADLVQVLVFNGFFFYYFFDQTAQNWSQMGAVPWDFDDFLTTDQ